VAALERELRRVSEERGAAEVRPFPDGFLKPFAFLKVPVETRLGF
jgi:hypothetical protein